MVFEWNTLWKWIGLLFKPLVEKYIHRESVSQLSSEISTSSQVIWSTEKKWGHTKPASGSFPLWRLSCYNSLGWQVVLGFIWAWELSSRTLTWSWEAEIGVGIAGTEFLSPVLPSLGHRIWSLVWVWPLPRLYRALPATSAGLGKIVGSWNDLNEYLRREPGPAPGRTCWFSVVGMGWWYWVIHTQPSLCRSPCRLLGQTNPSSNSQSVNGWVTV